MRCRHCNIELLLQCFSIFTQCSRRFIVNHCNKRLNQHRGYRIYLNHSLVKFSFWTSLLSSSVNISMQTKLCIRSLYCSCTKTQLLSNSGLLAALGSQDEGLVLQVTCRLGSHFLCVNKE